MLGLGLGFNIILGLVEVNTVSSTIANSNISIIKSSNKSAITNNKSTSNYSRYSLSSLSPVSSSSSRLMLALRILTNNKTNTTVNPTAFLQQNVLSYLQDSFKVYSRYSYSSYYE